MCFVCPLMVPSHSVLHCRECPRSLIVTTAENRQWFSVKLRQSAIRLHFPEGLRHVSATPTRRVQPAVAPHLDLRSVRRVGEDLGTNEPGSFAVREEVIVLIEELEGRSCGTSWMFGSNGHCGEDLGQWPDDVVHDAYGHRRESSDLIR